LQSGGALFLVTGTGVATATLPIRSHKEVTAGILRTIPARFPQKTEIKERIQNEETDSGASDGRGRRILRLRL
jgi:hypothetical protein